MNREITSTNQVVLQIRGLSKAFQSVQALDSVDIDVRAGKIHALIGRNGSGKSTVIKILSGYHTPDAGTIRLGETLIGEANSESENVGMGFVHQDLGMIGKLSVLENLALVRGYAMRGGRIDWQAEEERAKASLSRFGLEEKIHEPMTNLSKGEATVVAIARAVESLENRASAILVLDEPTSSLPREETSLLFETMRRLVAEGFAVLFVTHDLQEVIEIGDDFTILRDGRVAASGLVAEYTRDQLVSQLAGKSGTIEIMETATNSSQSSKRDRPVLSLKGISSKSLQSIDLEIYPGEVVGVTGLLGSGLSELAHIASARSPIDSGSAVYKGQEEPNWGNVPWLWEKIGFIPGNRSTQSILPRLTVRENIAIANIRRYVRWGKISAKIEKAAVLKWMDRLHVVPPEMEIPLTMLSGGNQQKALLGRWLSVEPDLMVVEGLTQGIDVISKAEVLRIIRQAAATQLALLLISYEFEEISKACDRLLLLRHGRIAGELRPPNITNEAITNLIS